MKVSTPLSPYSGSRWFDLGFSIVFIALAIAFVCVLLVSPYRAVRTHAALVSRPPTTTHIVPRLPATFEANQGQTDARVKFLSRGAGFTLFLTDEEAVLSFGGGTPHDEMISRNGLTLNRAKTDSGVIRIHLVGSNVKAHPIGQNELASKSNYLIGAEDNWITNVPHYSRVEYANLYPGIDVIYRGNQERVESDVVVGPGADHKQIRFEVNGAEPLERDANGELLLRTVSGEFRLTKPTAYQVTNNRRTEIASGFRLIDKNHFTFDVGKYDSNEALIIDPVLNYSALLGGADKGNGTGFVQANAIAVDPSGSAYVVGETNAPNFPTLPGDLEPSSPNPVNCVVLFGFEAFVTKLNPQGTDLVYSTYLGGSGCAIATGVALDQQGNAYITGSAGSGFPTTSGVVHGGPGNTTIGGPFVAKLNATGTALLYSTYIGGGSSDVANGIALDSQGNAYIAGQTYSQNFPNTVPPMFPCAVGFGNSSDFILKLDSQASSVLYSTCLGQPNINYGIAVDSMGSAYVAGSGRADSRNTPTGSCIDGGGYMAKFNPDGTTAFINCFPATPTAVALDSTQNIYVTGYTTSANFPITSGAFQVSCNGCSTGQYDAFAAKINPSGSGFVYATYLGGSGYDQAAAIAVDQQGIAYIVGRTFSKDFPTTGPVQSSLAGNSDAFLSELSADGSALAFSTFLGGSEDEFGTGVTLDSANNVYVVGATASTDFPSTPAAFPAAAKAPQNNGFIAKFTVPVSLSVSALDFGSQLVSTTGATRVLGLTNNDGRTPLGIANISTSGDFKQTNDCGSAVASLATCSIQLTLTPAATGPRSGTLTISDAAAGSPRTVALSGNGTDFSLGATSSGTTSATVTAGQSAAYNLQVNPASGFSGNVSLNCSGAPNLATCTISPSSVTVNAAVPLSVSVTTTASTQVAGSTESPTIHFGNASALSAVFAAAFIVSIWRWPTIVPCRFRAGICGIGLVLAFVSLSACGGGSHHTVPGTPAGTYTLVVTGTSNGVSHNLNLQLTVN